MEDNNKDCNETVYTSLSDLFSTGFFAPSNSHEYLTAYDDDCGTTGYCLSLNNRTIDNLKGIKKVAKEIYFPITKIDLSHNTLKKVNLAKILSKFKSLKELTINNSQIEDIIIETLPEGFSLNLADNNICTLHQFVAKRNASLNLEGNKELTELSKINVEHAFACRYSGYRALLGDQPPLIDDIKKLRLALLFTAAFVYLCLGTEYSRPVILMRGGFAGLALIVITISFVQAYYNNTKKVAYKGTFKL